MKPKYKLGMLVKTTEKDPNSVNIGQSKYGAIEGVMSHADGHSYKIGENFVAEDDIDTAYSEMAKRKAVKARATKKKRAEAPAQTQDVAEF